MIREKTRKLFLSPIEKFVKMESFSGILLFFVTLVALIWANSPYKDVYQSIWQFELGFTSDVFELSKPLILWINDGLMAVFFFLVGLEIKRELLVGELDSLRKATFPLLASIGGMVVPLLFYVFLNTNPEAVNGWAIPMATDIAFCLAILKLLGNRIPLTLKVFLTAFAIIDDLGAVMIIAIFYSGGIEWMLIFYSCLLLLIPYILCLRGIFNKNLTFIIGIIVWVLFLKAGIHPTIAGVLLAFSVPIFNKLDGQAFSEKLAYINTKLRNAEDRRDTILNEEQLKQIDYLSDLTDEFQVPLQRLEHQLHKIVVYFIMPIFALANAGISFSGEMELDLSLALVIAAALFLGKLIGISTFTLVGTRLKIAELPEGMNNWQVVGASILAGVGFTMSIFIANLAFVGNVGMIDSAKTGILMGSIVSGLVGFLILRYSSRPSETT